MSSPVHERQCCSPRRQRGPSVSLALRISPGLLRPDPLHLPGKRKRWGRPRAQLGGPVLEPGSEHSAIKPGFVFLHRPVCSHYQKVQSGWLLSAHRCRVEGLVLHACLEPLDPKRQRGGLTGSAFPQRRPEVGRRVGQSMAGQGNLLRGVGLVFQSSPSSQPGCQPRRDTWHSSSQPQVELPCY